MGSVNVAWTKAGLDLSEPDALSEAEVAAFREFYQRGKGENLVGHEFLLEFRPDVLKRYYSGAAEIDGANDERAVRTRIVRSMGFVHYYAITGWVDGIRQHMHLERTLGAQRSEFLDVLAIAALHAGPRGMQWVAEAVTEELRSWEEPEDRPRYPEGWSFDPAAFGTGLDFRDPDLSGTERDSIFSWYERVLGEVPRSVRVLADRRPRLLKVHRNRFENAIIGGLPKQLMPFCQLQLNLYRGFGEGIRTSTLMCRGFGMSVRDIYDCVDSCYHYGGTETIALFDQYAGDIIADMASSGITSPGIL